GECTRIAATSDSWMHVWMHVKFHRKHRGTEGVPVEVGVLVHNVALAVVGDPLQHILRRATAPAERDEGVSRRMERPGTDPSRLSVADERLVETRPGVVADLSSAAHVGNNEVIWLWPVSGVELESLGGPCLKRLGQLRVDGYLPRPLGLQNLLVV